ncbi:endonuclease [Metabacillus sp. GX 13764]|uniref:LAGLIDADG family homing endonuclease n=1 Tax=Metabacillus kandeliae TaxID=2900151 RepID=UPI001E304986|nr:LAGLIDADG family homing endonuclease [Metabacillus kandeliae]MCD7033630.1 endonuclease [Metabacillus kandeliae]
MKNGKRKRTMEIEDMIKLYLEGKGTTEIAEAANVSPRYVRLVLTENNVPKRPFGDWKRKYQLNEHYFKVWSNNMAYILGFFIADGFIASSQQTVSFAQKEKYILEKIRDEMGSNQVLYQNKITGVYSLNLNSKVLKEDLINIFGITSNKSIEVEFPAVPDEYLSHFMRGYFDGDGNINYKGYFINFVGGSFSFMNTLCDLLDKKGFHPVLKQYSSKHYRVYVSGRKTIKEFSDWIYKDKELFLHRKYELFQQEKLPIEMLEDKMRKFREKRDDQIREQQALYNWR